MLDPPYYEKHLTNCSINHSWSDVTTHRASDLASPAVGGLLGASQCCLFTSLAKCGLWARPGITVCSPQGRNKLRSDVFISHTVWTGQGFSVAWQHLFACWRLGVCHGFNVVRMAQFNPAGDLPSSAAMLQRNVEEKEMGNMIMLDTHTHTHMHTQSCHGETSAVLVEHLWLQNYIQSQSVTQ